MALLTATIWSPVLAWATKLAGLRSAYLQLRREHDQMRDLVAQGVVDARSSTGDSLSDIFEYMSTARGEYLDALEFVLIAGVLPTALVYMTVAILGIAWAGTGENSG